MTRAEFFAKVATVGRKAREIVTSASASASARAVEEPWGAAVALMFSHAVTFLVGAALFY